MSKTADRVISIHNDYVPVNQAIILEQIKSNESLRVIKANYWEVWGKAILLFSMAGSIILATIWLITKSNLSDNVEIYNIGNSDKIEAQYQDIVDRIIHNDKKVDAASKDILDGLRQEVQALKENINSKDQQILKHIVKPDAQSTSAADNKKGSSVNVSYTIFTTIKSSKGEVVTGRNYNPEDTKSPFHQYCYHSDLTVNDKHKADVAYIGYKEGKDSIRWTSDRAFLRKRCRFM